MYINLTPHKISLPEMEIPPSGIVARVAEISSPARTEGGVDLVYKSFGEVTGLPERQRGVLYIVSAMVRLAMPNRPDLVSPGDQIRDADGRIVGVRNLVITEPPVYFSE